MHLDSAFRRCAPVLVPLLLAASAYFDAAGASALVGAALVGPPRPGPPSWHRLATRSEARSAASILERNPFDSVTGPLGASAQATAGPVSGDGAPSSNADPLRVALCAKITALIVTESVTDRLASVAALQGQGEAMPRSRRVGDEVAGKTVQYIGFNPAENSPAVWLSQDGVLCQALLFHAPIVASALATPAPSAERTPSRGVPPAIASKIHKVSEREFDIDHAVIDAILERQAELVGSVRIVRVQTAKGVGTSLFGIRPGTLLDLLGLRNGDFIDSVNGLALDTPEHALEAFARLRVATQLQLALTRGGAGSTIDYEIR